MHTLAHVVVLKRMSSPIGICNEWLTRLVFVSSFNEWLAPMQFQFGWCTRYASYWLTTPVRMVHTLRLVLANNSSSDGAHVTPRAGKRLQFGWCTRYASYWLTTPVRMVHTLRLVLANNSSSDGAHVPPRAGKQLQFAFIQQ
jgi:hypothetical protein